VGTVSIEKSEMIAELLKKKNIPHEVLNARHHEREAFIVSQAGRPGAVTIATNMAGRGTDIQLGGNLDMRLKAELAGLDEAATAKRAEEIKAEVAERKQVALAAGGLYVIGTERHESRRIDNQLRGRTGRQGDPGGSKFFLSLEDDLMRIFGSQRMDGMLQKLGLKDGEAIIHPWINKALEKAQQKVEGRNFDIRKNLLKFDDVMNDQRKVIYEQRKELMAATEVAEEIVEMRHEVAEDLVTRCIPEKAYPEQWNTAGLHEEMLRVFNLDLPIADWAKEEGIAGPEIHHRILDVTDRRAAEKAANYGPEVMRMVEKSLLLQILDQAWKDHLLTLDHLRQGIGLRAYAQRDPLNEYKREAFNLFEEMLTQLREKITGILSHIELRVDETPPEEVLAPRRPSRTIEGREDPAFASAQAEHDAAAVAAGLVPVRTLAVDPNDASTWDSTPRNSPCPCGSGKKYKHCHGAVA
jgi:preprotein translocase subunit SecA